MMSVRPIRNACLGAGLFLGAVTSPVLAQNGDSKGEQQPKVDLNFDVPDAPILTPEQELATFVLPQGYRIELAAGDPQLHDPVDISFDASGRMWVVEMRGLMPDADGTGELEPVGSIATLSDTDGDGLYETRTVFADDLVLPRGICHGFGGVIAILPPELVWMSDTDGDGRVDETVVIDQGSAFARGLDNPEHAPNAPRIGLDNWLYLANHDWRYRLVDGEWQRSRVSRRGQWGQSQDDWGRWVYNYNSTPVHGDRVPPHYLVRNETLGMAAGGNARLVQDGTVVPSRPNTGVNRGYRGGTLNDEGRLASYTAACAPLIFRGTELQAEDRGAIFVCEPAGNLVRKNLMTERDGRLSGEPSRHRYEFLTSTDERFRPVNMVNGPDGALYIVDLYRGILQHRVFLTSFLRRQIEERRLDEGIGLGRVWRVSYEEPLALPETVLPIDTAGLDTATPFELVAHLYSSNGWVRATAQRLLIQLGAEKVKRTGDKEIALSSIDNMADLLESRFGSVEGALIGVALGQTDLMKDQSIHTLARLHSACTLEGLGLLDDDTVALGLGNELSPDLLPQWVRLSEGRTSTSIRMAWQDIVGWSSVSWSGNGQVDLPSELDTTRLRWQLAQSFGSVTWLPDPTPENLGIFARSSLALAPKLLVGREEDPILRHGLLSGIEGRELDLFVQLARFQHEPEDSAQPFPFTETTKQIGQLMARRGNYFEFERLFTLMEEPGLSQAASGALLDGFAKQLEAKPPAPFAQPAPKSLNRLLAAVAKPIHKDLVRIRAALTFASAVSDELLPETIAMNTAIGRGALIYRASCVACHQADGRGLASLAPPLGDPQWLGREDAELIKIVIEGISGKIEVEGKDWDLVMPPWAHLSNQEVADVLSYVLATFGTKEVMRLIEPAAVEAER